MTAAATPSGMLVLNPDVEIVSVREFPTEVRERLGGSVSDFIMSDRTSRIGSQRIGQEVAMFLRRFRDPRGIVEAVFEHSLELRRDPAQLLNEIYPLITELRQSTILIDPSAAHRRPRGPGLTIGDWFEGYRILECTSDLAETDVYKAESADGSLLAIKYLRSGAEESVRENLRHEISVLQFTSSVGCMCTPLLYAANPDRNDPYLCMEWIDGQTLFSLSHTREYSLSQRAQHVVSLLDAYAGLHQSGVLHGDVHPRNVLVRADGRVKLVDFGGARLLNGQHLHPRLGLVHYYEPEVARAVLTGQMPPMPSLHGEQYCAAGLAYSVIALGPYLALSLETEAALRQIASQPPRSFEELGVTWPAVERVLARALQKHPADRFATFSCFRDALVSALATTIPPQRSPASTRTSAPVKIVRSTGELFSQCVDQFTARHGLCTELTRGGLPRGPRASLYAGSAGIAYALFHIACLRQDAALLAAADVWISHALRQRNDSVAFTDGSVGALTETGPLALFHSETGLHAIHAMIRFASGDQTEVQQAITAFIDSVPAEALEITSTGSLLNSFPQDVTNGAPSLLLGAALLLPLCGPDENPVRLRLETLARDLRTIVHHQLGPARLHQNRFLGFAHGRTGAIYSLLRWAEVSGVPPGEPISHHLDVLASLARPHGEGLSWPIEVEKLDSPSWTGWCHGSAGHLLTWTSAARILQRPDYLEFALAAGYHIWESRGKSGPSLCCGGAGEALALYELARSCGDRLWADRGAALASEAIHTSHYVNESQGLFRAEAGIAIAAAESMEPAESAWPVCQSPL